MKRITYTITLTIIAALLSLNVANAQETTGTKAADEKAKQKELEAQKKAQADAALKKAEEEKKAQEKMMQEKMIEGKEMEKQLKEQAARAYVIQRDSRDLEQLRERAEELSKDAFVWSSADDIYRLALPEPGEVYIYNDIMKGSKPGTSWNYSRQVMEATFTNEFTMDAGDDQGDVNLAVSGDCAEGSISVSIILPNGKQLSEIIIDANGSLNWRKSFEVDEIENWKSGNWIFRINAKNATGNFRISMSAY